MYENCITDIFSEYYDVRTVGFNSCSIHNLKFSVYLFNVDSRNTDISSESHHGEPDFVGLPAFLVFTPSPPMISFAGRIQYSVFPYYSSK